ncbi:MAG: DUF3450 domain-containing protein [Bdellovibrionales bacterium]|nr:DUF3450 domain-containing protein [Bdellovibrionales bacterium]
MKFNKFAILILIFSINSWSSDKQKLDQNIKEQQSSNQAGVQSQKKVSKFANDTRDLLNEYRITLRKVENTKVYNEQLKKMIQSQTSEMESIKKQIEDLKNTSREITPLMVRMVDTLEKFVTLDMPFLPEERTHRVAELKSMLNRADVSVSEKYRRILEAYQVENEYGRTIEAYRGVKQSENKEITVDYFRVGRIALMYQSLDGNISGLWNQQNKSWDELPDNFSQSLKKGIRMARKQMAPDLVKIPVSAPEVL